jgi:hypothetical protein
LVINAVLSFMQEQRAAGVVAALRKRLQVNARVRRDSTWQVIPARELVPGDIVRVRPGDIIPADVKLLTGALSVDQSALTGESKDADKKPGEVLSSGSIVHRGEGNGAVMLTGAKTYFGRTTQLVQEARPKLHIEAVVAKVVRWLFVIVGALVCGVVVLSLIRGSPLIETLPLMLVLLMSAVPVALPVMFTVSMAVGSKELAKRGVLVIRLSAAEDAATMDVLSTARPRRHSTGRTMKSGAHSGSGPDANIPRNHATGSRGTTSRPCAIELGCSRQKRGNKCRMASRFGGALCMRAKPKSGGMLKSGEMPTRSTHSGSLTSWNVRSTRSSASIVKKPGLNRCDTGSAHAGLCSGLSRMR